jgi:hypothetical protein
VSSPFAEALDNAADGQEFGEILLAGMNALAAQVHAAEDGDS